MDARRRSVLSVVALLLLTTILIFWGIELPMTRLDVPYTFFGDAVDKLTQIDNVAETGWLFDNPRLGYPFGYDRLDFPRFDSLNYAVMGPLAALTGKSGLAMNLYFIASFYLIGLGALFAFRRLGLSTGVALLCALIYAFLPYHLYRGVGHLTNGTYFLVPLAMLVLAWIAGGQLDPGSPGARRRWWLALATALLLPLQMPYNGVFFAILCGVACLLSLARLPRWRSLWPALVLAAATSCAFVAEQVPSLLHKSEVGANQSIANRSAEEAKFYAMRLNQVLLPFGRHRLEAFAETKRGFEQEMNVAKDEFRDQYLGMFGILGLLALMWALARAAAGTARDPTDLDYHVRTTALLAIAILLLAMSSGIFTLLAYFVSSKIRATNRIYPFLAFACLLGSGWLLQNLLSRVRAAPVRWGLLAAIGALALLDVTAPAQFGNREAMARSFDRDQAWFDHVEQRLGQGAALFQLPVVWYPEHIPVGRMGDYEEFKPYLFSKTLRFSYGSAHGRPGYAWGSTVAHLPAKEMVERTRALGFSAILIDSLAYDDQALAALTHDLAQALPSPPMTSPNNRWRLFPLEGCCAALGPPQVEQALASAFDYVPDGTWLEFRKGGQGGLYRAGGWHPLEDWGVWSFGDGGRLRMHLRDVRPQIPLALELEARSLVGPDVPERHVVLKANGQVIGEIDFSIDDQRAEHRFALPFGLIGPDGDFELQFRVSPAASPRSAGLNVDGRPLGIGLFRMSIGPAYARRPAEPR